MMTFSIFRSRKVAPSDHELFVRELYRSLMKREPSSGEVEHWAGVLKSGLSDREVFRHFLASSEYKSRHRIVPGHPIGHYHSPVIDPDEMRKNWTDKSKTPPETVLGVAISLDDMRALWQQLAPVLASTNFPEHQQPDRRYYWNNAAFPIGDAAILRAMIAHFKPQRIVEIGSGFSSACMLDALDEYGLGQTRLTFIEPDPDRLLKLLRPQDRDRAALMVTMVQKVDLAIFDELEANDILFIDSSHVLKAGSDVCFELFEILPRLKPGVLIHFHDIHYPFELPAQWIFEDRYSWNEVYALRAFLMYNHSFKLIFFNHCFAIHNRSLIERTNREMLRNVGGSIWIVRT